MERSGRAHLILDFEKKRTNERKIFSPYKKKMVSLVSNRSKTAMSCPRRSPEPFHENKEEAEKIVMMMMTTCLRLRYNYEALACLTLIFLEAILL